MGSCNSFKMYVNKENLNGVDTIVNDKLEISPTLMCKPMLQFYNQNFSEECGSNLIQLQIQATAIQNQNQQDPNVCPQQNSIIPKKGSQSPTQRGILKTQQSYINSQNTSKKTVSFDKAKKRLSTKILMEHQHVRRRKVTMEMLEATF